MTTGVMLVEVDDHVAGEVLGTIAPTRTFAGGFPRDDDRQAIEGRERGALAFLVVDDGVVVGTCGTHGPPSHEGAIELGWGLVVGARGRGVGSAAVSQLLADVTARCPAATVIAHTEWRVDEGTLVADSPASEAILRRLGFVADDVPTAPGERAWRLERPAAVPTS
ncbi:MAG TPA: GNAT family N-acetyltransferase [Acidimicrobiales bacterium]